MASDIEIIPNSEGIHKDNETKTEWQYFDENCKPVHLSKVVYKNKSLIKIYPYSYSTERGITSRKVKQIELRGWDKFEDIPKLLRTGQKVRITGGKVKLLMSFLYTRFPDLEKLIIDKNGKNRFTQKTITFRWDDFESATKEIGKELRLYEIRRKSAISNKLATITNQISPRKTRLPKGGINYFLSLYTDDYNLSESDVNSILSILALTPTNQVSITENFLQTKDKINIAYLDDVISKFKNLLKAKNENEKDWQAFFELHGWILANLFPFQVILRDREAYVGGKTIENKEGRVVDFLYQNGFRDNYALLEIKTHNTALLKNKAYREPDVFAAHESLAGAIGQCLDQKNIFLREMGQKYKILDPKVILVVGMKSKLKENQAICFELMRGNQKNVELVTFDELLEKIEGLRSVLQS